MHSSRWSETTEPFCRMHLEFEEPDQNRFALKDLCFRVKNKNNETLKVDVIDYRKEYSGELNLLFLRLFPVEYDESFYRSLHRNKKAFVKIIFVNSGLSGVFLVFTKVDRFPDKEGAQSLLLEKFPALQSVQRVLLRPVYVASLGVDTAFRNLGLGSRVYDSYEQELAALADFVFLHTLPENTAAKRFYTKHGFVQTQTLRDFYRIGKRHKDAVEFGKVLTAGKIINYKSRCLVL